MSGRITELFNNNVFTDAEMKARLPKKVYNEVKACKLDKGSADIVAQAVRDWAIEKGATHFTHVFEPLTMLTAEKHDSFVSLPDEDGKVMMDFTGKELCESEPDGSSFPSGGIRDTSRARSYTSWDMTSPIYVKEDAIGTILCIPAAFCSYTGEALDKKTPLLRSMAALNKQALRILKLFGNSGVHMVRTSVGPEQEYFLVDKEMFDKRHDLIYTGRTLFGAKPPKGQEMDDHYFGIIKPRVAAFMKDLNDELWKLGILAKTQHNEVAPAQHELAPIYSTTNIATDHNQLTMEIMQKVASKHGLVCLLHEKPFAGVNGSGKHNNWSIATDTGVNLLTPGETPYENAQFLLFLVAVIKAVDEYQDLLRLSVATAGNDHRLGANEAPPAVISIFLGEELEAVLNAIESDSEYEGEKKVKMKLGVDILPEFKKDATDRNRTSPFAFTGNKFEFRMLGSSNSIACANIMLNSAVAQVLQEFADKLEGTKDFEKELHDLIKSTIKEHKRIIFGGNGYGDEWMAEAEKRGLSNYKTTADCMPHLLDKKNADMLTSQKVFTMPELVSRCEIMLENYVKAVNIEALTMIDMAKKEILPAIERYVAELVTTVSRKKKLDAPVSARYESTIIEKLSGLEDLIYDRTEELEKSAAGLKGIEDIKAQSEYIRDDVLSKMAALRVAADEAETLTDAKYWPFPTYGDLLFGVR